MVDIYDLPTDPAFARKVEQTEVEAWLDLDPSLDGSRQLEFQDIDGATLLLDRSRDWPHSRILNLGATRPATPEALASVLEATRKAGIETLMTEVSPIARPGTIARILTQQGFQHTERSVVVARKTRGMPEPASYFRIRLATPEDREDMFQIMQAVMPGAPDWCRLLSGQIGRPRWQYYVAIEDGALSGFTGVHLYNEMAWLAPIWTKAEYRNRGTQAALIAFAVRDAESRGVEWITTTYPATLPGRTRNFERLGFSIVYLRNTFVWNDVASQGG